MAESNADLARRGYEAARRGDLDAVREFLDPDVRWHAGDPTAEYTCHNREQALAFMRAARVRRSIGELVELVEAGDRVVVIMRRTGEDGEPELVANVTTFRAGKAIEMVHYPDPDDALAAVGIPTRREN
ncbi:MAG: nuclear transport factor 2 family protein [Solirubrobacterales bacterium]|nr:nuclear transport factor 2 family protein [Solirubrobacterales bacterium]MBV9365853.1 nuclear transport factor 2 family protein [Solirubrobacterales bacterium]MBV9682279.1 nuclear transport factor 2 family protein [Solirubrobacterales bacterium]MBV9810812.1 nuclear transport factor 2 family protein [Solirubrobacterales bacterium]